MALLKLTAFLGSYLAVLCLGSAGGARWEDGRMSGTVDCLGRVRDAGRANLGPAEVERAVQTLAELALRETAVISDDAIGTIRAIIAEIDQKLSAQLNEIMHHPEFQRLEGTWRGLHYLVDQTETGENVM